MEFRVPLAILAALLCMTLAVSRLETGRQKQGKQQLEQALRRTAVCCYALEGFYPPDVDYMCSHYGLQYDQEAYTVHYALFAFNLMPDITVLERDS